MAPYPTLALALAPTALKETQVEAVVDARRELQKTGTFAAHVAREADRAKPAGGPPPAETQSVLHSARFLLARPLSSRSSRRKWVYCIIFIAKPNHSLYTHLFAVLLRNC